MNCLVYVFELFRYQLYMVYKKSHGLHNKVHFFSRESSYNDIICNMNVCDAIDKPQMTTTLTYLV
ncbi:MAG: hypothetical protein K0S47_2503 [Herbinix sp.]|jgi:hypothetical protein|nr:hypothetical protein [Herbinix sp.]